MAQYTFVSDWLQLTAVNYELCTIGVRREWRPESAKIMLGDIGTNYVREWIEYSAFCTFNVHVASMRFMFENSMSCWTLWHHEDVQHCGSYCYRRRIFFFFLNLFHNQCPATNGVMTASEIVGAIATKCLCRTFCWSYFLKILKLLELLLPTVRWKLFNVVHRRCTLCVLVLGDFWFCCAIVDMRCILCCAILN